ncbi:MAG TPA: hypothetical protein VGO40_19710 [Longimicrobium sp.]|nr:hypothetical protein [Longimicrobium sp.]
MKDPSFDQPHRYETVPCLRVHDDCLSDPDYVHMVVRVVTPARGIQTGMAMKDVREQLSELVKRAAFRGEEITFGPNRGDDVTLIATERVRRMAARLREAEEELAAFRRSDPDMAPFAGLEAALDGGTLSVRDDERHSRRLLPNVTVESTIARAERVRLGGRDDRAPEFPRSRPRA